MNDIRLGEVESIFADIIWENEPLTPGELFKLAAEKLEWKRQTTDTVLKRLCDKGIFKKEGKTISSLISRDEFYARQSEKLINDAFEGSLPAFLAAFGSRKKLSEDEIDELKAVIENMRR
ncbi:MAG: BlaI/MecI/CopY family transcriptional regulator [Lachnospiraceae bacterium]|nr:BlaI/MecI/CopY family transcriptional regulator [Lachnospiraceae bacterium]